LVAVRRVGPADVEAWARLRVALMVSERLVEPGTNASAALEASAAAWLRERLDSPSFGAFVAVDEADGRGRPVYLRAGFAPRASYLQRWLGDRPSRPRCAPAT